MAMNIVNITRVLYKLLLMCIILFTYAHQPARHNKVSDGGSVSVCVYAQQETWRLKHFVISPKCRQINKRTIVLCTVRYFCRVQQMWAYSHMYCTAVFISTYPLYV